MITINNYNIHRLRLVNFRNYEAANFEPHKGLNVIFGSNGSGKTNLIEAISLFTAGRGLRNAAKGEIGRYHDQRQNCWGATAIIDDGQQKITVSTGIEHIGANRKIIINGQESKQADLSQIFNVIWLSPLQDRLLVDGMTERRRFLDRLVFGFDQQHASRIASYEKTIRERAKLLLERRIDDAWLSAIEQKIAQKGIAITAARLDVVKRLNIHLKQQTHQFPKASLLIEGQIERWLQHTSAIEAEDHYAQQLKATRLSDANSGITEIGSHRSNFSVFHLERNMPAHLCSTGEQKALLISIIFANAHLQGEEKGLKPVLLLDEVTAHLDPNRRAHLFDELEKYGMQVFMTGTEKTLFESVPSSAKFWEISDSHILEML